MAKISKLDEGLFEYWFWCEGCKCCHGFRTHSWPMPDGLTTQEKQWFKSKWTFNGNMDRPTIRASMLIHEIKRNDPKIKDTHRCHIFITDGKIEYLNDCTHDLAGQTVEMTDMSKITGED